MSAKSQVYEEIRRIVNLYEDGEFLNDEDFLFVYSHLVHHPWWNEKCPDGRSVVGITTGKRCQYDKHKCFFIHLDDGSYDDISAKKAVDAEFSSKDSRAADVRMDILRACRSAIKPSINAIRKDIYERIPFNTVSKLTGKAWTVASRADFHIDHYDMDFVDVVNEWLKIHNEVLKDSTAFIGNSSDFINTNGVVFKDQALVEDFVEFHNTHTHLRILPPEENMSRSRGKIAYEI